MDIADAVNQLRSMCAADSHPVLTDTDIVLVLDLARIPDSAGNPPANVDTATAWAASTEYKAGAVIKVGTRWWRALITATTAATAPTWPDLTTSPLTTSTVTDGSQTWIDNGAEWAANWDLRRAAADLWDRKAGLAAGDYDFGTGDQTFDRSQVQTACLRMARSYRSGIRAVPLC